MVQKELYLLPYAGGSSLSYHGWHLGEDVKVIPLDYKGHGVRLRENYDKTFDELVDDIVEEISNRTNGMDVNVFGHSMGSLVAWDAVNKLINQGFKCNNLIVSACVPPHLFNFSMYNTLATQEGLLNFIRTGNRLSENQINSKLFRDIICPISLNDYRLLSEYRKEAWTKVDARITCLYGEADPMIDKNVMSVWQEYTTKELHEYIFPGDHYYIEDRHNLNRIEEIMAISL